MRIDMTAVASTLERPSYSFITLSFQWLFVRRVIAPEGVTTPAGTHCPYGSLVGTNAHGAHNDEMLEQIRNSDYADPCRRILASIDRPITLNELTSLIEMLEDMSDDLE